MFITIEGIDGAGKTTQAARLAHWLENITGRKTIHTFEPGGWPEGKIFREFILTSRNFCALSELLLFLTDRSEHVDKIIQPELKAGHNVICERWNDSTLAYQSGGHGIDFSCVKKLIEACNFPKPDAKIFLDISPELAMSRIKSRKNDDKFEEEGLKLMNRTADFYRSNSDEFIKIDCDNLNENETFTAIITKLEALICAQSR